MTLSKLQISHRMFLLLAVGMFTGCFGGAGDRPDTGKVTGVVTLDGSPLEGATVTFQPAEGRPSAGETDSSGKYVLMYSVDVEGAKVGQHTVTISKEDQKFDGDGELTSSKETVPSKYNQKTELTEKVESGENTIDFTLTSK